MPPIRRLHRNTLAAACLAVSACAAAQQAPAADAQALKKGELLYMRCVACHDLAPARSTKIGPTLHGVYGRVMGSVPDFAYSDSLRELRQQSLRWDDTQLDRWLEKPVSVAPGTTMSFIGLPKAADRAALIAYLKAAR